MALLDSKKSSVDAMITGLNEVSVDKSIILTEKTFSTLNYIGTSDNAIANLTMVANKTDSSVNGSIEREYTRINIETKVGSDTITVYGEETLFDDVNNIIDYLRSELSVQVNSDEFVYDKTERLLTINGRNWYGVAKIVFFNERKYLSNVIGSNPIKGPIENPADYPLMGERERGMKQTELWAEVMNAWLIKMSRIDEPIDWSNIQLTFTGKDPNALSMLITVPKYHSEFKQETYTLHYQSISVHYVCYSRNGNVAPMPLKYPKKNSQIVGSDHVPLLKAINEQYNLAIPIDSRYTFYYDSIRNYCVYNPLNILPLNTKDTGYFTLTG